MSVSLYDPNDFNKRFAQQRDELVANEHTNKITFGERMAGLINEQQVEILKLQKLLRDNTVVPARHAVTMAVSSIADPKYGGQKHVLVATASDLSMWILENFSPGGRPEYYKWGRIPPLPQAADEADAESKT
jgi:hypothetical protein